MLITIAGLHGTGKTTIASLLATHFNLKHISTGMLFRQLARERGMDIVQFSEYAAKHKEVDIQLDEKIKAIGLKGDVILDGQLCWYFLNEEADWKILLLCDVNTRIKRIVKRKREITGSEITFDSVLKETLTREDIEQRRYNKIYGIDLSKSEWVESNHNLLVDTTTLSIDQVVADILRRIQ
ncbi:MAG: (d)CMP kinase [Promethearchaeota archaeon]